MRVPLRSGTVPVSRLPERERMDSRLMLFSAAGISPVNWLFSRYRSLSWLMPVSDEAGSVPDRRLSPSHSSRRLVPLRSGIEPVSPVAPVASTLRSRRSLRRLVRSFIQAGIAPDRRLSCRKRVCRLVMPRRSGNPVRSLFCRYRSQRPDGQAEGKPVSPLSSSHRSTRLPRPLRSGTARPVKALEERRRSRTPGGQARGKSDSRLLRAYRYCRRVSAPSSGIAPESRLPSRYSRRSMVRAPNSGGMGPDKAGFPSMSSQERRERRPISGGMGPDRSVCVNPSRVRLRRAPISGGMAPVTACRAPIAGREPTIRRLVSCERWPSSGGRTPIRWLVAFAKQYAGQMPVTRPSALAVTPAQEPSPIAVFQFARSAQPSPPVAS